MPSSGKSVQDLLREGETAARAAQPAAAAAAFGQALDQATAAGTPVPRPVFVALGNALLQSGDLAAAQARLREGARRYPKDFAIQNMLGVVLKNLGRFDEALQAFDLAEKLDPRSLSPQVNRGNVLLAMRDGHRALKVYRDLVRRDPRNAEMLRLHGVAHRLCGDLPAALDLFEKASRLAPKEHRPWMDLVRALRDLGRNDDALAAIERALRAAGPVPGLVSSKAVLLQHAGRQDEAWDWLRAVLQQQPDAHWAHSQLGRLLENFDREQANIHLREAVRLAPQDGQYLMDLADSLDRTRGPAEGANIQEAYRLARRRLELGGDLLPSARSLASILERNADYEAAARLGSFDALGRHWARSGQPAALHHHLARVVSEEDRRHLVDFHRTWGRTVDALASRTPLKAPPPRPANGRVRVGIMSSDLRDHPVSYFALPLLEGYDRSRFEFYCYSWSTKPADRVQQFIAGKVDAFRLAPRVSARDAAQIIRNDGCDILFELGGTTDMNLLDAMAWRPAPVQVSWLGYPHSSGLESIDRILVDPYLKPADPALLIEQPFELQRSWVVLGYLGFHDRMEIVAGTPQERTGRLTFGTMNNPYKYRPALLATWADIVRQVPGSRFLFVRPEGAVDSFRENIWRAFEAGGVERDRVEFVAVRGTHIQHYNQIDIALDSFPQTGGTTTCECLWMGVPVVSLVGPAFFERLSYSNLSNAGLGDLCVLTREDYVAKALALAADAPRRQALRRQLREQIRSLPLGRPDLFVDDFQQTILRTLEEHAS